MLAFIPDTLLTWVVNIVFISGVVGFAASFFFGYVVRWLPSIAPYHLLIQIVSIVLLVCGVYFKGGYSVEMEWRKKVAELEAKIAVAEQQSKDANVKLEETIKEKTKVVKEKQIVIQTKIKEVEKIIDAECKVSPEVIQILNEASKK